METRVKIYFSRVQYLIYLKASTKWFRKIIEIFLALLEYIVILLPYDLVSMIKGAVSFLRCCKI